MNEGWNKATTSTKDPTPTRRVLRQNDQLSAPIGSATTTSTKDLTPTPRVLCQNDYLNNIHKPYMKCSYTNVGGSPLKGCIHK